MFFTAILIIILLIITYFYIKSWILLKKSNMPFPFPLPLIGHVYKFLGNTEEFTKNVLKLAKIDKYINSVALIFGKEFTVNLYNPDDIEYVSTIQKKSKLYNLMNFAFGDGLFISYGERHRQSKKVVLEGLSSSNLRKYVTHFNEQSQSMVDELKIKIGQNEFNMDNIICFHIFKNLIGTILGLDANILNDEKVVHYVEQIARLGEFAFQRMYSVWLHPDFLFKMSSMYREQKKITESLHSLTEFLIEERRRKFQDQNESHVTKVFIDTYFKTKKDNGEDFTIKEMIEDIFSLFVAGLETTSASLCMLVLLMAIHPDVQQKVYDELVEKFGDKDHFTLDDIQQLTYMEQVVNEMLRFFSPLPVISRDVTKDMIMPGNRFIPKGSSIMVFLLLLHRHPEIYPNPSTFNPENFSPENMKKRLPNTFLPFGIGGRKCIAGLYGKYTLKVMLAHLLKNFIIRTSLKMEDIRLSAEISMKNKSGTVVSLNRREHASII